MHQINTEKLTGKTRAMIDAYLSLPIGTGPNCPYFNNRRRKIRGSLGVAKGKGTPEEITKECKIAAKLSRINIADLSQRELKEFLISKDLGIDCSGFAYHVLNTLSREKTGKSLANFVKPLRKGFIGSLLARLRPAENIGVAAFAHEKNSFDIKIKKAKPGDIITFMGTGKDHDYNHILVIIEVNRENDKILISYAHSYSWPSDGTTDHGVREGTIIVSGENLLSGTWTEKNVTGGENYTFESARTAQKVSVKRLGFNSN